MQGHILPSARGLFRHVVKRIRRIRRIQSEPLVKGPSFRARVEERMEFRKSRQDPRQSKLMHMLDDKMLAYRFLARLASRDDLLVRSPHVYVPSSPLVSVDAQTLGDRFVLKPHWGSTSRGVFLVRKEKDHYVDRIRRARYSWEELVLQYEKERRRSKVSRAVYCEEWVDDGYGNIPLDYRMYTFFGEVKLIQQRDCNRGPSSEDWRFRYYDREWNTLENVRHGGSVGHDLVPPSLGRIAVEQAEKISEALPIPFLRIDFYITLKEVILGEFTPQPGSYAKFSPTFDRMMGEAWDAAALRLEASAPAIDEVLRLFQKPNPND